MALTGNNLEYVAIATSKAPGSYGAQPASPYGTRIHHPGTTAEVFVSPLGPPQGTHDVWGPSLACSLTKCAVAWHETREDLAMVGRKVAIYAATSTNNGASWGGTGKVAPIGSGPWDVDTTRFWGHYDSMIAHPTHNFFAAYGHNPTPATNRSVRVARFSP